MDTALPQIFQFILDRNLAKANCTGKNGKEHGVLRSGNGRGKSKNFQFVKRTVNNYNKYYNDAHTKTFNNKTVSFITAIHTMRLYHITAQCT